MLPFRAHNDAETQLWWTMLSPTKFHTIQQPSCKLGQQKTNFHIQNKFKQIGLAGLINVLFSLGQQKNSKYTVWPSLNPDPTMEPRLALEHPCIPTREAQNYFMHIAHLFSLGKVIIYKKNKDEVELWTNLSQGWRIWMAANFWFSLCSFPIFFFLFFFSRTH